MAAIKSRHTKPELKLRKALFAKGLRYRLNHKLPGKPDLCFPGKRVAVFVDGCFWHGCPEHSKIPENNHSFWEKKLGGNVKRDIEVNSKLKEMGWKVFRCWEHEVVKDINGVVMKIFEIIREKPQ